MRVLEEGIVRSVNDGGAEVMMSMGDNSACASCGLCNKSKDVRVMTLDAGGLPELTAGNHVRIEIDLPSPYIAVWLMFAQPLALLVAGIFIGMQLGETLLGPGLKGLASVVCALLLVAANYLVVSWMDRRFFAVRRARAKIVEIIS